MLSACTYIPKRALWLVDEYVMKSELPGGLLRALQRVKQLTNTYGASARRAR